MKTQIVAVLWILFIAGPVQAQEPFDEYNFYVNFRLGLAIGAANQGDDASSGFDANFEDGTLVSGGFGYRFNPNFRLEAEIANRTNDVDDTPDTVITGPVPLICILFPPACIGINLPSENVPANDGKLSTTSYMVNAYYDFRHEGRPGYFYLGAGLGAATVSATFIRRTIRFVAASDTVLAYQFTLGWGWDFDPRWGVTTAYRFFQTEAPDFKNLAGLPVDTQVQSHELLLNLMWRF